MRLREIQIRRLPGIEDPYTIAFAPDVTLVVGPNGSGKSSILRALRALVWPGTHAPRPCDVRAVFTGGDGDLVVERQGSGPPVWRLRGVETPAPPVPGWHLAHAYRLGALDLLRRADADDARLAGAIRAEMAGGFDLSRLRGREEYTPRPRPADREHREYERCEREQRRLRQERAELETRSASLDDLVRERDEAERAAHRVDLWRIALSVVELRRGIEALEADLRQEHPALERLGGREDAELGRLDADIAELEEQIRSTRREIDEARDRLAEARLERDPPPPVDRRTWQLRLQGIETQERELARLRAEEKGAAEARRSALEALDPAWDPERGPVLDAAAVRELRELARRLQLVEAERRQRRLEREDPVAASPRTPAQIARGAEALEDWLAARPPHRPAAAIAAANAAMAAVAAVGVALGARGTPLGWLLAGLGAGGGALLWLGLRGERRSLARRRADCRGRFLDAEGSEPAAWTVADVRRLLSGERVRLVEAERAEAAARSNERLDRRLADLEREAGLLADEGRRLCERLGIPAGVLAGGGIEDALEFAARLHAYQEKDAQWRAVRGQVAETQARLDEALGALRDFLAPHGAAPPHDAAGAQAVFADLATRWEAHEAATVQIREREPRLARLERGADERRQARDELFRGLGLEPGDRDTLKELLERRPQHLERRRQVEFARRDLEGRLARLRDHPAFADAAGLPDWDEERLLRAQREDEERAATAPELRERIIALKLAVDAAERGTDLQDARAEVEASLAALEAVRGEQLERAAGRFWLERLESEFRSEAEAPVLARARALLARFTARRYRLEIAGGEDAPGFRVHDSRAETLLDPSQLSDGTRAQLFLAIRLAFLELSEEDLQLPLILDEALTTSDPERFAAIADCLAELVAGGTRQVVYLTADPADAAAWQAARRRAGQPPLAPIDLAALRGEATAATIPDLEPPAPPAVPSPAGMSAELYARRLQVPRLDPRRPAGAAHLYYLLADDLETLAGLLRAGIAELGQWENLAGAATASGEVTADRARLLDARAQVLRSFLRQWRIGRGRPVDREALEACPHVTEVFLDRVAAVAAERGQDARRLLEALEAGGEEGVRGFGKVKRDRLAAWLEDEGYLDPRPTLGEHDLLRRVTGSVAPLLETGDLTLTAVGDLCRRLGAAVAWAQEREPAADSRPMSSGMADAECQ